MDKPDLSTPSLMGLSYVLRNLREVLPRHCYMHDRFAEYSDCGTAGCAIGVCQVLWPEAFNDDDVDDAREMPRIGYFSAAAYDHMFNVYAYHPLANRRSVTPEMVADRIDAWLAQHGETRDGFELPEVAP